MSNKLGLSIVASITLLLTGCGGGGGSNTPASNEEESPVQQEPTQTLCQVEGSNVIIGDEESCEYNNQMLSCSNGRVTLGGMNAETINLNGTQYICASKYNSGSANEESVEEQKPSDSDTEDQSTNTAENLLNGKTLYETYEQQAKNREYYSTRFENDLAYVELFAVDGNVLKSSTVYDLVYSGDTITYIAQDGSGSEKECTVKYDPEYIQSYQFTCTNEQGVTRYEYMSNTIENAIQYPVISAENRTLEVTNIVNGDFILSNEILNFSITTNRYIDNNRAEIDSYYKNGLNKINIKLNRTAISEYVYLFFHQSSIQNLQNTGSYVELFNIYSDTIALDMQVQNSGEYEFTYNESSVSITDVDKFSSFPVDAYLYLFVCKDATFSLDTCNYASIPVKLY